MKCVMTSSNSSNHRGKVHQALIKVNSYVIHNVPAMMYTCYLSSDEDDVVNRMYICMWCRLNVQNARKDSLKEMLGAWVATTT